MIRTNKFSIRWVYYAVSLCLFFIAGIAQAHTNCYVKNPITVKQVIHAQEEWAEGLVAIGEAYTNHKNYRDVAANLIDNLYAYNTNRGKVLFKPTKASEHPFRTTYASALSYFIGGDSNFAEDSGFALTPWTKISFNNDQIYLDNDFAIAMGQYTFTDTQGKNTLVDYTFGYKKVGNGDLKIVLHHSSLPFNSESK